MKRKPRGHALMIDPPSCISPPGNVNASPRAVVRVKPTDVAYGYAWARGEDLARQGTSPDRGFVDAFIRADAEMLNVLPDYANARAGKGTPAHVLPALDNRGKPERKLSALRRTR